MGSEMGQFIDDQSSGQQLRGKVAGAQTQLPPKEHLVSQTCQQGEMPENSFYKLSLR